MAAQLPAHFEPIDAGEHAVENHQVGPERAIGFERRSAIGRHGRFETRMFQVELNGPGGIQVVFDH
jgi:hypothetical protein